MVIVIFSKKLTQNIRNLIKTIGHKNWSISCNTRLEIQFKFDSNFQICSIVVLQSDIMIA